MSQQVSDCIGVELLGHGIALAGFFDLADLLVIVSPSQQSPHLVQGFNLARKGLGFVLAASSDSRALPLRLAGTGSSRRKPLGNMGSQACNARGNSIAK